MADSPRTYFDKRRAALSQDRQSWVARAKDIALHVAPEYDRFQKTETNANKDEALHDSILDSTATLASETFASGLRSGSSNPARKWFLPALVDTDVSIGDAASSWLYNLQTMMLTHYQRSNFYKACVPFYREGGLFGTAVMYQCEHPDDFMRFHNYAPGEYYLACDYFGLVNTCYRDFSMTAEQLVSQFGIENVCERTRNLFKNGQQNTYVQICHAVEPVSGAIPNVDEFLPRQAKYRSVYFEIGRPEMEVPKFLSLGYYWEFPIWTYRIGVVSTNTYGFGRAHMCLGDIKQLQEETKQLAMAVEKGVSPPIKAPSGTDLSQIGLQPNEISLYDAALGQNTFGPLYEVNPAYIAPLQQTIAQLQQRINDTFFVGTFQPLTQLDRREITAREVDERVVEKFTALGPVFDPLEDGAFDVGFNRTFAMLARAGKLPPAPEELQGRNIRAEYQSITTEAQKASNAGRIERMTAYLGSLFQASQDPNVWDVANKDEMATDYAESVGLPPDNIVPADGVADMREQRQKMQYAQQAIQMAGEGAKATRNLATADTSGKNALTDLSRMAGTSPEGGA